MKFTAPAFVRHSVSCSVLAGVLCLSSGCTSSKSDPASNGQSTEATNQESPKETVANAIQALHPLEFEFQVERSAPSEELNGWANAMLADLIDPEVDEAKLTTALKPYLDEAAIARVLRRQFVPRDSVAIRDALWARAVAESVMKSQDSDINRVVRLFQFVTQVIHVVKADRPPLGLFETLQLGTGTAEDRAWVFGLLVQQLKLPTVVIEIAEDGQNPATVLVGVLNDSKLSLFDASVGLPLPAANDDAKRPLVNQVATLDQVLASDALLRQWDIEGSPYPYHAEQFKTAKFKVVGETGTWSRRFEGLQNGMTAHSTAVIFQPLLSVGEFKGAIQEVSEALANQVSADQIGVWSYPELRREQVESLTSEQVASTHELFEPFQAPLPVILVPLKDPKPDEFEFEVKFGKGWKTLQKARVEQLIQQNSEAIQKYLSLQNWARIPPVPAKGQPIPPQREADVVQRVPDEVKALHFRAAEMSFFWRASAQLSLGRFNTAAMDFEAYITRVGNGSFAAQAQYMAGLSTALEGRQSRGAAFMSRVGKDDPQYRAARYLIKRWKAAAEE